MTRPIVVRQEEKAPIGRTLGIAQSSGRRIALACLLGAGAIAADIGLMGCAAWLISRAAQHPNESVLAIAIVGVQFFGLSRGFLRYEERLVGHDTAFRVLAAWRVRVYRRLEQVAPGGLPAFRRGDLLARMVRDVDSLQDVILRVIPPFSIAVMVGVGTVAVMWWMLPAAGLVLALALVVAATVVPWLTGALAQRRESRFSHVRGELSVSVVDLIEGAPELVAFGATGAQLETVRGHDAALASIATASAGTAGIGLALTTLLSGLGCWGCLMVGVPAVRSGALSGVLLAVIVLIPLAAFELVVGLPVATQALGRVRQAAARVFAVTDAPVPVVEPLRPALLPTGPPSIALRSVWASYPGATASALRGVDLDLSPGRRVAVVGPSGSGKSTLAAVLLRFLATESGEVTLNGTAFDRFDGDELRTVVGLVDQDAHLFETTIAENLRVGRREASDIELRRVLDRVGLGPWLDDLPLGMTTEVGRFGSRLSGGQRQRLAVARALLADFPVLILDEPAEHLDPEAAAALTVDLLAVTVGRSLLFITHRLTGLESVDEIVVMDQGRIVERGAHHILLAEGGHYSKLWWEELRVDVLADKRTSGAEPSAVVSLFPPTRRDDERGIS
jgi:ATP-binding cassette subfamily C protein CydC